MCELWYVAAKMENGNQLVKTHICSKQCQGIIAVIFSSENAIPQKNANDDLI